MMRQNGFSLLVVLVFLIILALLGFSAVQNTLIQEKIIGNNNEKNISFLAAEAALREAEIYLGTVDNIPVSSGSQPYRSAVNVNISGVASNPSYTISCINNCQENASGVTYYRVQATGWGGRTTSVTRLEMVISVE